MLCWALRQMKTELKCPRNVPDMPCVVSVIKRLYFKTLGSFSHFSDITFLHLRQLLWEWHSFQVINTQWHSPETWHPVPNQRAASLCIQLWPLTVWLHVCISARPSRLGRVINDFIKLADNYQARGQAQRLTGWTVRREAEPLCFITSKKKQKTKQTSRSHLNYRTIKTRPQPGNSKHEIAVASCSLCTLSKQTYLLTKMRLALLTLIGTEM